MAQKERGPSFASGKLPRAPEKLRSVTQPHIESFDYFLREGLHRGVEDVPEQEVFVGSNEAPLSEKTSIRFWIESVTLGEPSKNDGSNSRSLLPRECRERGLVYTAPMRGRFQYCIGDSAPRTLERSMGSLPIMVLSSKCRLRNKTPKELMTKHREEASEFGGYFIINGIERVVRLLQVPRRNYPMAIERTAFKNRGASYSAKAVTMRCARPNDQSTQTVTLHYLETGNVTLRFSLRKQEFLVPMVILLRALAECTDIEIYERLLQGDHENMFLAARVELLLEDSRRWGVRSRTQALRFLGERFRDILGCSEAWTDVECGSALLRRYILVHLSQPTCRNPAKFECLLLMARKLYAFVQNRCRADNSDALSNHELLLPGHLFSMYVKEKIDEALQAIKQQINRDNRVLGPAKLLAQMRGTATATTSSEKKSGGAVDDYMNKALDRTAGTVGTKCVSMLSTGNIISTTGLDLMQVSGFTIVADRLNALRYISHFRSVHRGQFFTTMKTTAVRKLLPESWGFLCPVHTPDGGPCGLLQHLALPCTAICSQPVDPYAGKGGLRGVLVALGVTPAGAGGGDGQIATLPRTYLPCVVDGEVVGAAPAKVLAYVATQLRRLKVMEADQAIPGIDDDVTGLEDARENTGKKEKKKKKKKKKHKHGENDMEDEDEDDELNSRPTFRRLQVIKSLEVAWLPPMVFKKDYDIPSTGDEKKDAENEVHGVSTYPGLFLFTQPARMVRPVIQLESGKEELVGPLEQVFMEIACLPDDVRTAQEDPEAPTTHREVDPTSMLSLLASLTPFSDYNQGPRIMYQCQMAKQTMGTPFHSLDQHPENKAYKIQTPQAALVQTRRHGEFQIDDYPQGTNAVVAVISYTGYDMEDAMILNKSSYERGFAHASVYKTKVIDLAEERKRTLPEGRGGGSGGGAGGAGTLRFSNRTKRAEACRATEFTAGGGASKNGAAGPDESVPIFENLDDDGIAPIGAFIREGDPICCVVDDLTGKAYPTKHKDSEPAFIQTVRALGPRDSKGEPTKGGATGGSGSSGSKRSKEPMLRASITLRYPRNPIIGDKFSSRHGQKGVLSILWPQEDMPFSESGMTPDVIINPHAFPSRMTIGMLLESLAGKSGALNGMYQDATPFSFHEKNTAVDYFGEQLAAQGYSYYGSEALYSGVSGTVMHADIYMGVVYYQRLRHMVSDKSQVRATGPVNSVTMQPIKGRKRHGGIRLGEMERDALLAHGCSFLLSDRLMNCSDRHIAYVCTNPECGSLLSPMHTLYNNSSDGAFTGEADGAGGPLSTKKAASSAMGGGASGSGKYVCRNCRKSSHGGNAEEKEPGVNVEPWTNGATEYECVPIALPYVFRYLTNELAGLGIRIKLKVDNWKQE